MKALLALMKKEYLEAARTGKLLLLILLFVLLDRKSTRLNSSHA